MYRVYTITIYDKWIFVYTLLALLVTLRVVPTSSSLVLSSAIARLKLWSSLGLLTTISTWPTCSSLSCWQARDVFVTLCCRLLSLRHPQASMAALLCFFFSFASSIMCHHCQPLLVCLFAGSLWPTWVFSRPEAAGRRSFAPTDAAARKTAEPLARATSGSLWAFNSIIVLI